MSDCSAHKHFQNLILAIVGNLVAKLFHSKKAKLRGELLTPLHRLVLFYLPSGGYTTELQQSDNSFSHFFKFFHWGGLFPFLSFNFVTYCLEDDSNRLVTALLTMRTMPLNCYAGRHCGQCRVSTRHLVVKLFYYNRDTNLEGHLLTPLHWLVLFGLPPGGSTVELQWVAARHKLPINNIYCR